MAARVGGVLIDSAAPPHLRGWAGCCVNAYRPWVAANDVVVIVCQCDNVPFPISSWSWTCDEGGIMSGRQSAVICHRLNELLPRHPFGLRWRYCLCHRRSAFWAAVVRDSTFNLFEIKPATWWKKCWSYPGFPQCWHVEIFQQCFT